jgi:hypothetical protein
MSNQPYEFINDSKRINIPTAQNSSSSKLTTQLDEICKNILDRIPLFGGKEDSSDYRYSDFAYHVFMYRNGQEFDKFSATVFLVSWFSQEASKKNSWQRPFSSKLEEFPLGNYVNHIKRLIEAESHLGLESNINMSQARGIIHNFKDWVEEIIKASRPFLPEYCQEVRPYLLPTSSAIQSDWNASFINNFLIAGVGPQPVPVSSHKKMTIDPKFWEMLKNQNIGLIIAMGDPFNLMANENDINSKDFVEYWGTDQLPAYAPFIQYSIPVFHIDVKNGEAFNFDFDDLVTLKDIFSQYRAQYAQRTQIKDEIKIAASNHETAGIKQLTPAFKLYAHCMGGIGRTGAMALIFKSLDYLDIKINDPLTKDKRFTSYIQKLIDEQELNQEEKNYIVDFFINTIFDLRSRRGPVIESRVPLISAIRHFVLLTYLLTNDNKKESELEEMIDALKEKTKLDILTKESIPPTPIHKHTIYPESNKKIELINSLLINLTTYQKKLSSFNTTYKDSLKLEDRLATLINMTKSVQFNFFEKSNKKPKDLPYDELHRLDNKFVSVFKQVSELIEESQKLISRPEPKQSAESTFFTKLKTLTTPIEIRFEDTLKEWHELAEDELNALYWKMTPLDLPNNVVPKIEFKF